ncbi:MAG: hypothetical protein GWP06_18085, partial [Actinobacteria bacterium]|nr:hypothetical protein [Actinomycetota bacterium]
MAKWLRRLKIIIFIILLGLFLGELSVPLAIGGDSQISPYFNLKQYNLLLDYAVNSGSIQVLHPLNQPYFAADLFHSFETCAKKAGFYRNWAHLIKSDLQRFVRPDSMDANVGYWDLGANATHRMYGGNKQAYTKYRTEIYGIYILPNLVLMNRTVTDQLFNDDPLYEGDTSEWIQGRVEDAYALFKYKSLRCFGGRLSRNFGMINEPSLVLSDHPYSYDHFGFSLAVKRLQFSFYTSRLNDLVAFNSQAIDTTLHLSKRYFSVQRGEIALRRNLHFALSQIAIYGGTDQGFEPFYLNPMNLYYPAQRNNRVQMNGLWAAEVYWKPASRVTLFTQWLIDDVIVNNEPGQNDRAVHPDRMGITSKLILTDYFLPGGQFSLVFTRIGNWTYQSYRTWENYTFRNKSMGYPENSVQSVFLDYSYFGRPPFIFSFKAKYKEHGAQNIIRVFGDTREKFPRGIVEEKMQFSLSVQYMPN